MKFYFSLFLLLTIGMFQHASGQATILAVKDYVDKNLTVTSQEKAAYYRLATLNEDSLLTGEASYYYLTNNLYVKGNFEKDKRVGKWQWWYNNGNLRQVGRYGDEKYYFKIENFWDSTGTQLVKEGNGKAVFYENGKVSLQCEYANGVKHGKWIAFFDNGSTLFDEIYADDQLIEGISYNQSGEIFKYTKPEAQPQPVGGYEAFYKHISRTIQYPKTARKRGIEGKVFVGFVIDKDGRVTDVTILKGIGGGCDEEAVRVVEEAPKWSPGLQRGQPVRVRMSVPIIFNLG